MAHCVHTDLHHWEVESSNLTVNKTSPLTDMYDTTVLSETHQPFSFVPQSSQPPQPSKKWEGGRKMSETERETEKNGE